MFRDQDSTSAARGHISKQLNDTDISLNDPHNGSDGSRNLQLGIHFTNMVFILSKSLLFLPKSWLFFLILQKSLVFT
jgi:hypothetical protein